MPSHSPCFWPWSSVPPAVLVEPRRGFSPASLPSHLSPLGTGLPQFPRGDLMDPIFLYPFLLVATSLDKRNGSGTLAYFPETSRVCASWRVGSFRRPEPVQAVTGLPGAVPQPPEPPHALGHLFGTLVGTPEVRHTLSFRRVGMGGCRLGGICVWSEASVCRCVCTCACLFLFAMETIEFGAFFYKASLLSPLYGLAVIASQALSPRWPVAKVGGGHEWKDPQI